MAITGADAGTAQQYLDITNWHMEEAVNLFMESGGSGAASGQASTSYGDDDVRAPDAAKRQRLVGGDPYDSPRMFPAPQFFTRPGNVSRYNDFTSAGGLNAHGLVQQDFAQESIERLAQQMNSSRQPDSDASARRDPQNLSQLFQPPTGLMFHGSFADARRHATEQRKWLLVNIQDETVFASLMLNRDTWSDDLVQNLVASGFVFWQTPANNEHGKKFCALYQVDEGLLPIVCILDPRTGAKLVEWHNFIEPGVMTEKLSDFCCLNDMETAPPARPQAQAAPAPPARATSLYDASEEEQLAAAIAASLEGGGNDDSDDDMVIEEKPSVVAAPPVLAPMPEEPADGPSVTRIQIRTATGGRLLRRFQKTDPLELLWRFVRHEIPEAQTREFELRSAYPPKAVAFDTTTRLCDAQLENASLMMNWTAQE
ncbi:hypothetical protein SPRG_10988 [Saprolegnia parasitica CBS 223.65]|uniref:UBX domain-containing protein n=1 Tax=Saprolegnia parasitica (strain CBS 223.65) TaxID=695850 RepID=A0A067BWQ2_SAPPC|nr:hypothetical protein SPRG_10988 [Saprolegnia parasitica CBS 223.65]KDO22673.1 hypothetical protein SPRG_10988 [Saprolegnia parasitica CBS 223.65]|eukprot:XP_012206590.1 hypothetical protein SPRG_10988 [Saprolegnia parasitica CBS 223.65]